MAFDPGNLLIVGAGFSKNAGLPLASDFTRELLNIRKLKLNGPSSRQVKFIRAFVDEVFGEGTKRSATEWPDLEDIFTLVDLSANTGHHLGPTHSSADLRILRRAIIVRMIRMLSQAYTRRETDPDADWRNLEELFTRFDLKSSAVLSMNWDTAFEQGIERAQGVRRLEYGCEAIATHFIKGKLRRWSRDGQSLHILKPHGSVNWLYCDACRETFWVPPSDTEQVAQTLFRKRDWAAIQSDPNDKPPTMLTPACPACEADALGTRFATFSYRKALDFPMHAASWRTAEQYLKGAIDWIFFGYSMPAADFEFKQLLKRVQLTEKTRPKITVITGGEDADSTIERFKKFFGDVPKERFFFKNGLDRAALDHLADLQVLQRQKTQSA